MEYEGSCLMFNSDQVVSRCSPELVKELEKEMICIEK